MYSRDPPTKVLYCYGIYSSMYDTIDKELSMVELHEGLPTRNEIEEFANGEHRLIILDDLMQQILDSKEIERLATQGCHHMKLSLMFLTQNMYGQGKTARTIALNCWYTVLFRNLRGTSQVAFLGQQLFPKRSHLLLQAYNDATESPFGYLVLDFSPSLENDKYRFRTNVFPGEDVVVYFPKIT